jgi:hypothetical protein
LPRPPWIGSLTARSATHSTPHTHATHHTQHDSSTAATAHAHRATQAWRTAAATRKPKPTKKKWLGHNARSDTDAASARTLTQYELGQSASVLQNAEATERHAAAAMITRSRRAFMSKVLQRTVRGCGSLAFDPSLFCCVDAPARRRNAHQFYFKVCLLSRCRVRSAWRWRRSTTARRCSRHAYSAAQRRRASRASRCLLAAAVARGMDT